MKATYQKAWSGVQVTNHQVRCLFFFFISINALLLQWLKVHGEDTLYPTKSA